MAGGMALVSITAPRAVFTKYDPRDILAMASASIIPCVSAVSGV
jgi:hypothetical protein